MRILHTNDFHGHLTREMAILIHEKKEGGFYFDSGDCVRSGNLSIPVRPEPCWEFLAAAGCDASVIGNRETHLLAAGFRAKLAGSQHPVLCANLRWKGAGERRLLPRRLVLERGEHRYGVFGLSVPMVTEKMTTKALSEFIWDDPIAVASEMIEDLRDECEDIFCLSHLGDRADQKLAELFPQIQVIFGGHSHSVLEEPMKVNQTWIAQGGSHGRFLGVYDWDGASLTGKLLPLKPQKKTPRKR